MKIRCRLCESTLSMKEDGSGAVCPVCGMSYSMEALRQMFQKANPRPAEPVKAPEPVRPAEPAQAPETVKTSEPARIPEPVKAAPAAVAMNTRKTMDPVKTEMQKKHSQSALEPAEDLQYGQKPSAPNSQHGQKQSALDSGYVPQQRQVPRPKHAMNNESFGLDPSQYVRFDNLRSPAYVAEPQPKAPGLFASAAVKQQYEEQMAAWRRAEAVRFQEMRRYNQLLNAQADYWEKFYEQTNPAYSLEEDWKPYFEAILAEEFPEYNVYKDVSCGDLFGVRTNAKVTFLLVKENRAVLAIILSDMALTQGEPGYRTSAYWWCRRYKVPALMFFTRLSNRRAYVTQRIRKTLQTS